MGAVTEDMIRDAISEAMNTGGKPNRGMFPYRGRLFWFERDPRTDKFDVSEVD